MARRLVFVQKHMTDMNKAICIMHAGGSFFFNLTHLCGKFNRVFPLKLIFHTE